MEDTKTIENAIIKNYLENQFLDTCDIKIDYVKHGEASLSLEVEDKHTNIYGAAHGGVLATMMDTAMGMVAGSLGARVVTLNLNVNYINSIYFCDKAVAVAHLVHKGMSTMVLEAQITNTKGDLIAKATGTFFVVGKFDGVPEKW